MRFAKRAFQSILFLAFGCGIAAAALPGPHRALAPTLFGLTEIAPDIFTDAPARKADWLAIVEAANVRDRLFFGTLQASPRYILCATMACERTFGKQGNVAQTYGWSMIHIPPKALENFDVGVILMAHERVHAEIVYKWGASALWDTKIPSWFNEGIATYISRDYRIESFYAQFPAFNAETRSGVLRARYFWDWGSVVGAYGWHDAYGAAAENVKILQRRIGDDGLRQIISRSIGGENFDSVVQQMAPDVL